MSLVVFGLTHIDLPVSNLKRSLALYEGVLGFAIRAQKEGIVELESGTMGVRLVEAARPEHRAALRVWVEDPDAAARALVDAGATLIYAVTRTPEQELVAGVRDPDGHTLNVYRPLTEDEYDFIPELPKELTWDPAAEELLKSLLKSVPVLFRALARRRVTKVVEELAETTRRVGREDVIRGFILASPKITRARNRRPLIEHGIDPDQYKADWEAD